MSEANIEVLELNRRIRIMENDKKAYQDESNQMLQRQGKLIDRLKEENRTYCKQMVSNSQSKKQMGDVKKTMDEHNHEINQIKTKI